jgi:hypothetical protein
MKAMRKTDNDEATMKNFKSKRINMLTLGDNNNNKKNLKFKIKNGQKSEMSSYP